MHNNAEFLSRNKREEKYVFKRKIRFHLRKSVVTFAKKKKIINVNGTFIA